LLSSTRSCAVFSSRSPRVSVTLTASGLWRLLRPTCSVIDYVSICSRCAREQGCNTASVGAEKTLSPPSKTPATSCQSYRESGHAAQ
jgi:hypothetical protein